MPVVNRTYYSTSYNDVTLKSYFGKNDWISCQWTTTTRENRTSLQREMLPIIFNNTKLNGFIFSLPVCRDNLIGGNQTTNGTIEPLIAQMNKGELRSCSTSLSAPEGYRIQFSCSAIKMTSLGSVFNVSRFNI